MQALARLGSAHGEPAQGGLRAGAGALLAHACSPDSGVPTVIRPEVDTGRLAELLEECFGLTGVLSDLPGDRDRNFLLAQPNGERCVVKVSSPSDSPSVLRFEAKLVEWLNDRTRGLVPGMVPSLGGELLVPWADQAADTLPRTTQEAGAAGTAAETGTAETGGSFVRVVKHVGGLVLADLRTRPPELLADLGRKVAQLSSALGSVPEHPPARFGFEWALGNAEAVMERAHPLLGPDEQRLLERIRSSFDRMAPRFLSLGSQMIHGDINDHNVLVSGGDDEITGIIDLGDAHSAPRVFDLAIAIAYAVSQTDDPLTAAAQATAGFHGVQPLLESEIDVLVVLARARLGQSVSMSRLRRESGPVDDYHLVSERPAWETIRRLDSVPDAVATGMLREACGLEPVARSAHLREWLSEQPPAPVVHIPSWDEAGVLDLGVGSTLLTGRDTDDTVEFTRRLDEHSRQRGWRVALGRYMEPRAIYTAEAFAADDGDPMERRTVHLGIDFFAKEGTPVFSPFRARVAGVSNNSARLDYGPTVVLEHESPAGPFWTLFGHLAEDALDLRTGVELEAGESFASIGPYPVNGDWPPHLHFQIIVDRLGLEGDFPGVATPRQAAVWGSLSPDPNLVLGLPLETTFREALDLRERRGRSLGGNLSLSYKETIHIVRGRGAHLYDLWGREYLDCVNNPAHVGHEHPAVVRAGQRQMAVLNTNTRYLHERVIEYAERLISILPEPLAVCYFVNSGSEANELALRMARSWTGHLGVAVLEGGYHGHTTSLIELSHYKKPRHVGRDPNAPVRAASMPDGYRGRYRRGDPRCAERFAESVATAVGELSESGHGAAAFLAESVMSCGGQIEFPDGYLAMAYRAAREVGAVCIADEVQVGFGRLGSHAWGFEAAGAVPDIVTLGKPMGNGHPIGAVVTTAEIAERFSSEMEFFSTFGGNPVSAAIGLAVLDVIEDEDLQHNALEVGAHLKQGLCELAGRFEAIGDVRGRGLFLGIDLVRDPDQREPDRLLAEKIVNVVKQRGVLLSTDGPDGNVIKIKPPMVFSRSNADRVVEEVGRALNSVRRGRSVGFATA